MSYPFYLSIGTEHIPAAIADVSRDWLVFPQHRCHSWLLSFGADPSLVAKEIVGRADGLNKGMAGSASLGDPSLGIYGHDGLLGSTLAISAGYCEATNKKTLCILGDGALESDSVLASLGYITTRKLPLLMVCEDNDLSICTPKHMRRSWNILDVATGFGLNAFDIQDDVVQLIDIVENIKLPALINVHVWRHKWHAGIGEDEPPRWDTLSNIKDILLTQYSPNNISSIEKILMKEVEEIWQDLLMKT